MAAREGTSRHAAPPRSRSGGRRPPPSGEARARAAFLGVGVLVGIAAALGDGVRPKAPPALAVSPPDLGWRRWLKAARRAWGEFTQDNIPAVAAGVSFFSLLSIFPAVGAFVSLYGIFADVAGARRQIAALQGVIPEGAVAVIRDQIDHIVTTDHGRLGLTFAASLLVSIWSSNAGMKAMMAGLNVAFEERERRNFFKLNAVSLAFTVGATVFLLLSVLAISVGPGVLATLGAGDLLWAFGFLRWPFLLVFVGGFLSLLFRYGACRREAHWRWITPGSALGALGWLVMSLIFSWYVAHFGNYDRTYGSLGAVVGFMTWIWLSVMVVLLGAELNSELEDEGRSAGLAGPEAARLASPSARPA